MQVGTEIREGFPEEVMSEVNRLRKPVLQGKDRDGISGRGKSQAASGSRGQCEWEVGVGPSGQGWGQGLLNLEKGLVCRLEVREGHKGTEEIEVGGSGPRLPEKSLARVKVSSRMFLGPLCPFFT